MRGTVVTAEDRREHQEYTERKKIPVLSTKSWASKKKKSAKKIISGDGGYSDRDDWSVRDAGVEGGPESRMGCVELVGYAITGPGLLVKKVEEGIGGSGRMGRWRGAIRLIPLHPAAACKRPPLQITPISPSKGALYRLFDAMEIALRVPPGARDKKEKKSPHRRKSQSACPLGQVVELIAHTR